jgi:hypothetical protein
VNQQAFFNKSLEVLTRLEIAHMVTGSVGAMFYSIPRMTNDMDIVVELSCEKISQLIEEFPPPIFYTPPADFIEEQIKNRGQFNIIHLESGSKVDFILRKNTPFGVEEFSKRKKIPLGNQSMIEIASPEAIILSKLSFYRQGGSEKHLRDIQSILQISKDQIDFSYLESWMDTLKLHKEWKKAQQHPFYE